MEWYRLVWSRYAEFEGRSRRTEYWMFLLFNTLAVFILAAVGGIGLVINRSYGGILFVLVGLYFLAAFIPCVAVSVRRLHDSGKSGWLLLLFMVLGMIPVVGMISAIVQIVLMCQDSVPGTNQYGPNPKFPGGIEIAPAYAGIPAFNFNAPPQNFTQPSIQNFCSGCGAALPPGAGICSGCGRPAS